VRYRKSDLTGHEEKLTMRRSDLEDGEVKKEYERGYKTLLDFFHQYL
jgi:hypothetical protein